MGGLTDRQRQACMEARRKGLDSWGFTARPVPTIWIQPKGGAETVFFWPTRELFDTIAAIADATPVVPES